MTKNQKMLLGVGAVAVVGYLLWKKQQISFTGAVGRRQKNAVGSKIAPYGIGYPCGCTSSCRSGICTKIIGNYAEIIDCTVDSSGNRPCNIIKSGTIYSDSTSTK